LPRPGTAPFSVNKTPDDVDAFFKNIRFIAKSKTTACADFLCVLAFFEYFVGWCGTGDTLFDLQRRFLIRDSAFGAPVSALTPLACG
jgi:hypothetical protein